MNVAIVVSSVPHYYAARIRALNLPKGALIVLSAKGSGDFTEFVHDTLLKDIPVVGLQCRRPSEIYIETVRLLASYDPDVVAIAGWATPECHAAIIWARRNGKRIVIMSASQPMDAKRVFLREAIKSRIVCACDTALVAGRHQRDYIVSLGMPESRTFFGYDAVDNAHFEQGAKTARAEQNAVRCQQNLPKRYLLASARFIPKKNLTRLVEAYAKAIAGLDDTPDLVILGDGPEGEAVEMAITRSGVAKRVHLPGFRGYDLLPAFYGLAEGFVHVSTVEQWGLVMNEAAAAGLPLIVSEPCGAAAELLRDGENGFLVNPADTDDIACKLRRLVTLPAEIRTSLGEASRRIVADWGVERFAEGFMAACDTALSQPTRRLAPWDYVLIRALAHREIAHVS